MSPGVQRQIMVKFESSVPWKVARDPESGTWIGVCDALNLNAVGDTWIEFAQCASEAMELLFQDLFESGELEGFFRENGWVQAVNLPAPGTTPRFDVPINPSEVLPRDLVPA